MLLDGISHLWLQNVLVDLRRYAAFAIGVWLVLWVLLRPALGRRKIRTETPPARQLLAEFAFSVRSIALFSTVGVGMTLLDRAGFYPLASVAASWGAVWFAISLILMILGQDAYVYWTHRAMHRVRVMRGAHVRHHKSQNPSPFTAYSFDLGEAALMVGFVALWPLIVPTPWGVIPLFLAHQIFRNTLLHSGYEFMPARPDGLPLLDWVTTTVHHDLHHGQARWNYAPWFTWWDRWLGTEHPDYQARFAAVAWRLPKTAA